MSELAGTRILGRKIGRPLTAAEQDDLRGAGNPGCTPYNGYYCNGQVIGPVHSFQSGPDGPTDYLYSCCPW